MRIKMWEKGLPVPHLQADILDHHGIFIGRPDFFYPEYSVGVEYDGEGKYRGQYGITPEEAAISEMQRTKQFGNAGIWLIRITAQTLNDGSWIRHLSQTLKQNRGKVFPAEQWRSAGLAWIPNQPRRPRGSTRK
ncbi:hypothetical protein [Corynebacterium occultum]|nr:hypothetical protein [Corynebacterium occultum]